eukprot:CAMPEP_0175465258 /NCGR_PEP_ID=MMETSP0095-20121207/70201_1 /TAXON_ID=311494 /ORGANISM="Alexandrium monilatum, Strain CCMP3105" /LENGTH=38 /DNA_ID= /DNA_START= /DNA_END= /DNA_ORIENTATION=
MIQMAYTSAKTHSINFPSMSSAAGGWSPLLMKITSVCP